MDHTAHQSPANIEHPSFEEYGFGDDWMEWYGGDDPDGDLATLRTVATRLIQKTPDASVELVVLDDITTFVRIFCDKLEGEFGSGCEDRTCYLRVDADPTDMNAPEWEEVDNLTVDEVVDMVDTFWLYGGYCWNWRGREKGFPGKRVLAQHRDMRFVLTTVMALCPRPIGCRRHNRYGR